jgi:hypothetical protein
MHSANGSLMSESFENDNNIYDEYLNLKSQIDYLNWNHAEDYLLFDIRLAKIGRQVTHFGSSGLEA